ncbi:probable sodium/metabolite cotransporter BASS4, chloroplastic isoform X2 [Salvia miltiorrhiza]|uniref:probable sodium/metabolite cotransporter BASS4, chloroplastic isoform X2 n=1 Tax=Salvia miltiorrhiza TaxID=226208 RepID=UPI0025ABDBDC|nr:probable sodium/metabolite cotransporter BASS4, chloroplastic isoform X2 [Salvia miltiorrhiza]
MARALQALIPHTPITGIPSFRLLRQLPSPAFSPIPNRKSNVAPCVWELHSVYRIRCIKASAKSLEGNGDGEEEKPLPVVVTSNWTKTLANVASDNFLPLALICGVLLGLANPGPGCLADKLYVSKISTFGIFVISGLTLRSDEIGAATEAWPVGLFGLASILFFTPLFSKIILMLKLQPQEFVTGLAIFCCMPTTLSSGVALTRLAGGNSALALAMTLISNLLGILIIPYSISKFIAAGVGVAIPTEQLLRSLVLTLLVPLILGKVARELSKGIADFADGNRKLLAVISAIFLSSAPWIQVSRSRSLLLMVKPEIFLVAVIMGVLLHFALFSFNALLIPSLSLITGGSKSPFAKKENTSALLLVASQKTLPVMVAVVEQLGGALGASGLLVLPCVAAHLNQIIIDSFIVSLWKQKEGSFENAKIA